MLTTSYFCSWNLCIFTNFSHASVSAPNACGMRTSMLILHKRLPNWLSNLPDSVTNCMKVSLSFQALVVAHNWSHDQKTENAQNPTCKERSSGPLFSEEELTGARADQTGSREKIQWKRINMKDAFQKSSTSEVEHGVLRCGLFLSTCSCGWLCWWQADGTHSLSGALRLFHLHQRVNLVFMATKGQFITQESLSLASLWLRCDWGWMLGGPARFMFNCGWAQGAFKRCAITHQSLVFLQKVGVNGTHQCDSWSRTKTTCVHACMYV